MAKTGKRCELVGGTAAKIQKCVICLCAHQKEQEGGKLCNQHARMFMRNKAMPSAIPVCQLLWHVLLRPHAGWIIRKRFSFFFY